MTSLLISGAITTGFVHMVNYTVVYATNYTYED